MQFFSRTQIVVASLLTTPFAGAQSFYVDVTNSTPNAQVHLPNSGDYTYYPSVDQSGAGFSAGSGPFSTPGRGTYYVADGFLTGSTANGLWKSSWLDALHPQPDTPPHGGEGTIDIVAPGGIRGAVGLTETIYGNGLRAAPAGSGDTNGQYLGIGGSPASGNSEYALWGTPIVITETTTFQYQYYWAAAGATLVDGTEIVPVNSPSFMMGAQFFILSGSTEYPAADVVFSESSALQPYLGAGNQEWLTEDGTFTLAAGTYYWGFSATGNASDSYIVLEGISINQVPEPSAVLCSVLGAALLMVRRPSRR